MRSALKSFSLQTERSGPMKNIRSGDLCPVRKRLFIFTYKKGLPAYNYSNITGHWKNLTRPVKNITAATNILYDHKEKSFHEFEREPLIPHMVSTEGPALTVADLNHDGLDDLFIGSSRDG